MKLNEREDRLNYFNHLIKCFGHAKLRLVKHYRLPGIFKGFETYMPQDSTSKVRSLGVKYKLYLSMCPSVILTHALTSEESQRMG